MIDWLKLRREDMEKINSHLNETNIGMLSLEHIESRVRLNSEIHLKIFILKMDHIVFPLMERIHQMIGYKPTSILMLPVFPIISAPKDRLKILNNLYRSRKMVFTASTQTKFARLHCYQSRRRIPMELPELSDIVFRSAK